LHLPRANRVVLLALQGPQGVRDRGGGNLGHGGSRVGPVRRETSRPAFEVSTRFDTEREGKITRMGEIACWQTLRGHLMTEPVK
jgi:hypothetical protein